MKLTKTLLAAAAVVAMAVPMSASAQVVLGDLIGQTVVPAGTDMVILRNGEFLQAVTGSAVMANDEVFVREGSGTVELNDPKGGFSCSQVLAQGMKVGVGTGDVCSNLGNMARIGARDAVNTAGMESQTVSGSSAGGSVGGGSVGGGLGGGLGTGFGSGVPLAIAGVAAAVAVGVAVSDDDDDDGASN